MTLVSGWSADAEGFDLESEIGGGRHRFDLGGDACRQRLGVTSWPAPSEPSGRSRERCTGRVGGRCRSRRRSRRQRFPIGRRTAGPPLGAVRVRRRRAPSRRRRGKRPRWPARAGRLGRRSARRGRWWVRRRAAPSRGMDRWWRLRPGPCRPVRRTAHAMETCATSARSPSSRTRRAVGAERGHPRRWVGVRCATIRRIGRTTAESGRWPNETGNGWR